MPKPIYVQAESNEPLSLFTDRYIEDGNISTVSGDELERLRSEQERFLLERSQRVAQYHDTVMNRVQQAQQQSKLVAEQKRAVMQHRLAQIVEASGIQEAQKDIELEQRSPLQVAVDHADLSLKLAFEVLLRRSATDTLAEVPEYALNKPQRKRDPVETSDEPFWDRGVPQHLKFTASERQAMTQAVKSAEIEAQRAKIQRRRLLTAPQLVPESAPPSQAQSHAASAMSTQPATPPPQPVSAAAPRRPSTAVSAQTSVCLCICPDHSPCLVTNDHSVQYRQLLVRLGKLAASRPIPPLCTCPQASLMSMRSNQLIHHQSCTFYNDRAAEIHALSTILKVADRSFARRWRPGWPLALASRRRIAGSNPRNAKQTHVHRYTGEPPPNELHSA